MSRKISLCIISSLIVPLLAPSVLAANAQKANLSDKASEISKNARQSYQKSKDYQTIITLRPIVRDQPGCPAALNLADLLIRDVSTHKECATVLRNYVRVHPDNEYRKFQLAQILSWGPDSRQEAIQRSKDLVQNFPKKTEYRYLYAQLLLWTGHYDDAKRELEICLQINPNYTTARIELARMLSYKPEHIAESVKVINKVISLGPKGNPSPKALLEKAVILALKGDSKECMSILNSLYRSHPYDVTTTFRIGGKDIESPVVLILAETSVWFNEPVRAQTYFEEYLDKYPKDSQVRAVYSNLLLREASTFPQAEKNLREAIEVEPQNCLARVKLAQLLGWTGKSEEGLEFLTALPQECESMVVKQKVLGEDGGYPISILRAVLASQCSEFQVAVESCKKYLAENPSNTNVSLFLAELLSYQTDRQSEALELITQTLKNSNIKYEQCPVSFLIDYVRILSDCHKLTEALEVANYLLTTKLSSVQEAKVLLNRARVYVSLNRIAEAKTELVQLQNNDDKQVSEEAKFVLATVLSYSVKTRAESIIKLKDLLELYPNKDTYRRAYADALYWNNEYAAAAENYAIVLEHGFTGAKLFANYASCLFETGKEEQAILECTKAWAQSSLSEQERFDIILALLEHQQSKLAYDWLKQIRTVESDKALKLELLAAEMMESQTADWQKTFDSMKADIPDKKLIEFSRRLLGPDSLRALVEASARESLHRNPQETSSLKVLSTLLSWQQKSFDESLSLMSKYLELVPSDFEQRIIYAYLLYWLGEDKAASHQFNLVLHDEPTNYAALKGWSETNMWSNSKEERKVANQRLIKLAEGNPNDKKLQSLLAESYESAGDITAAEEKYKTLFQKTGSLRAKCMYANILIRTKRENDGYKILQAVLKEDPSNREALLGVAFVLHIRGSELGAEKLLKKARELYPNDPEIEIDSAKNFLSLGRIDKAEAYAEQAFQHAQKKRSSKL